MPPPVEVAPPSQFAPNLRVLVADDQITNRRLLRRAFTRYFGQGWQVTEATTAEEALALALESEFALIVMSPLSPAPVLKVSNIPRSLNDMLSARTSMFPPGPVAYTSAESPVGRALTSPITLTVFASRVRSPPRPEPSVHVVASPVEKASKRPTVKLTSPPRPEPVVEEPEVDEEEDIDDLDDDESDGDPLEL